MKIYLAGPDVFRKDPHEHFAKLKEVARKHGIEALSPFDNDIAAATSKKIFYANVELIDKVDAVVANLAPFRGLCVDDGTAFEIGYAYSRKIKIFGYTRYATSTCVELAAQLPQFLDKEFPAVEDFGQPCNLMITEAILETGGKIMESFEECVRAVSYKL